MKSALSFAAIAAFANANAFMNSACCNNPLIAAGCNCPQGVSQSARALLAKDAVRCACPMPAASSPCSNALTVTVTGCGCQPANCVDEKKADPVAEVAKVPRKLPEPTKVISIQCFDITSYREETKESSEPYIAKREKVLNRKKTVKKVKYEEETAVRYKMQKVIEIQKKKVPVQKMRKVWETRPVEVPVPIVNGVSENCCGNIAALPTNKCTCAPEMKFEMKTITKRVQVDQPYTDYVEEDCEVEVMKRVPYNVKVNKPVVTFEQVDEPYTVVEEYIATETREVTQVIPVVTRQCKDAHGKIIENIADVPLFASGPTENQLNIENLAESIVPTEASLKKWEKKQDDPLPDQSSAEKAMKAQWNREAQLVVAPLDDVNSEVGFIQVGGISNNGFMTLHEDAPVGRIEDLKDDCGLNLCRTKTGCVPCVDGSRNPASPAAGVAGWRGFLKQDGPAEVTNGGSSSAGW